MMMVRAMMMPTILSMMVKSTNVNTTEVDSLPNSHLEISEMIDD